MSKCVQVWLTASRLPQHDQFPPWEKKSRCWPVSQLVGSQSPTGTAIEMTPLRSLGLWHFQFCILERCLWTLCFALYQQNPYLKRADVLMPVADSRRRGDFRFRRRLPSIRSAVFLRSTGGGRDRGWHSLWLKCPDSSIHNRRGQSIGPDHHDGPWEGCIMS